jgi:hypothetical protein
MRSLSVRELIIETQQQVQRLGGYKRDVTVEHRIIWRLNSAQDQLVRKKIKPSLTQAGRFMIDEPSRQAIQALITSNKKLPVHKDTVTRGFAYLPSDYGFLISDRSIVLPDCKSEFNSPTEATTYIVTVIPFNDSPLTAGPFYHTITARSTTGVTPTDFSKTYDLASKKEKFEIIDAIANQFKKHANVFGVYWETFDSVYNPNSFLVVRQVIGNQSNIPSYTLLIDGQQAISSTQTITTTKYKTYAAGDEVPNRSYQNDFLYDAVSYNYYDQPEPDSPVSQLAGNKVFIFTGKRFLVPEIIVDYIRKPRRISVYLDQTSELDGSVQYELCSLAAEQILGDLESNYPLKNQTNLSLQ